MAGSTLVAVPSRPEFFEFEERPGPNEIASLIVKVNFPPACAWCGNHEVEERREISLDGTIRVKQSAGKKAAATLIAGPLAGSAIGADKTYEGPFKFTLPACEEHRHSCRSPRLKVHSTMEYWEGGFCLLDLKDEAYAAELCRINHL